MLKDYMRVSLPPRVLKFGGVYWATEKMKERFTVEVKAKDESKGKKEKLQLYKPLGQFDESGRELVLIPRACCPVPPGDRDKRSSGYHVEFNCTLKPRSKDQEIFISQGCILIAKGESFIAKAPTGFGKTAVTMKLIEKAATTTLIIVHKEDIETQWRNSLKTFLGLKDSEIGLLKGNICRVRGKKVVIGYVQSLCKEDKYPSYVYNYFGLVVPDEVHKLGATEFSQCAWLFSAKQWLGLSATPYRKDGRDILLHAFIGEIKVNIETLQLVPQVIQAYTAYEIPRVPRWNPETERNELVMMYHKPGRTGGVLRHMRKDEKRNSIICDFVAKAYQHGRYTIIFSENKEHLRILEDMLVLYGINRNDIGYYIGGLSEKKREEVKKKRVCLATYAMTESATDNPIWSTAVMATPRSDVNQIIGRVLRVHESKCCALNRVEGKKIPIVLDLIDSDSRVFLNYAKSRAKYYKSIGAPLINS
ncbi:P-loop containing nucleoside triphosphate hydrolase [Vibrio phage vB_ValS_PJ32]|nr:P-loop containing nucleoside triphosphate hydrolase [Vibrio phage vB_ValS_PJ32]